MSRRDHKGEGETKITLPITPMLDMTFQLLFFFMLNFNPAPGEGAVEMALPTEAQKAAHKAEDRNPMKGHDKKELKFESDLTVKVRAVDVQAANPEERKAQGSISAISVSRLEGTEDAITGPNNDHLEGLRRYLTEKRKGLQNKEAIKLQGGAKLRVKYIIDVMDVCREAGFPNISFVQPDDFGG